MEDTDLAYARVIGEKLRAGRQQRQMTLRELAAKANMSASMLSQIETGKAYPSVRSIYNIASALALPIDYFFPEQDTLITAVEEDSLSPELTASEMREAMIQQLTHGHNADAKSAMAASVMVQLLHASARPTIRLKGGVSWSRLTAAAEPNIEILEISYAAGAASGTNLSYHDGREFGLVLEGELVVQLGFNQYTLVEGDTIVFDSTTPHRLANKSAQPMRAMWVVWNWG
ncbi:MAG: cupin domain-containing protein [Burkholderiales bacterium]|nr:cupin domain-containing protein [Anaerolineae bacterium]